MGLYLIQGLAYGFSAAVQPGPFQTYIIAQALDRGWRRALPVALAPLVSDGPIVALVLLVLSRMPVWLQQGLYLAGGAFVLSLAWGAFTAWRDFDAGATREPAPPEQSVLKAALTNALSPAPYIYWSVVTGPILLTGWRETPVHGVAFLAGFYGALVGALAGIIVLFGAARELGPRVNRILLGVSALALAAFGIYQLYLGVSGWT
jgi:threonine/homoserine/homoserine lactone efflux protein